jgi:hypothetical protein
MVHRIIAGSTEVSADCTCLEVHAASLAGSSVTAGGTTAATDHPAAAHFLPAGRPLDNTAVFIVPLGDEGDSQQQQQHHQRLPALSRLGPVPQGYSSGHDAFEQHDASNPSNPSSSCCGAPPIPVPVAKAGGLQLTPCEPGVVGQIAVAGLPLALGYLAAALGGAERREMARVSSSQRLADRSRFPAVQLAGAGAASCSLRDRVLLGPEWDLDPGCVMSLRDPTGSSRPQGLPSSESPEGAGKGHSTHSTLWQALTGSMGARAFLTGDLGYIDAHGE